MYAGADAAPTPVDHSATTPATNTTVHRRDIAAQRTRLL